MLFYFEKKKKYLDKLTKVEEEENKETRQIFLSINTTTQSHTQKEGVGMEF